MSTTGHVLCGGVQFVCVSVFHPPTIFPEKQKKMLKNVVARSKGDVASLKIDEPFKIKKKNFFFEFPLDPTVHPTLLSFHLFSGGGGRWCCVVKFF